MNRTNTSSNDNELAESASTRRNSNNDSVNSINGNINNRQRGIDNNNNNNNNNITSESDRSTNRLSFNSKKNRLNTSNHNYNYNSNSNSDTVLFVNDSLLGSLPPKKNIDQTQSVGNKKVFLLKGISSTNHDKSMPSLTSSTTSTASSTSAATTTKKGLDFGSWHGSLGELLSNSSGKGSKSKRFCNLTTKTITIPRRSCMKGSRSASMSSLLNSSISSIGNSSISSTTSTSTSTGRGRRLLKEQQQQQQQQRNVQFPTKISKLLTTQIVNRYERPQDMFWSETELDFSLKQQLNFRHEPRSVQRSIRDYIVYHKRLHDELAQGIDSNNNKNNNINDTSSSSTEDDITTIINFVSTETKNGLLKGFLNSYEGLERYYGTNHHIQEQKCREIVHHIIQYHKAAKKVEAMKVVMNNTNTNNDADEMVREKYRKLSYFDRSIALIVADVNMNNNNNNDPEANVKNKQTNTRCRTVPTTNMDDDDDGRVVIPINNNKNNNNNNNNTCTKIVTNEATSVVPKNNDKNDDKDKDKNKNKEDSTHHIEQKQHFCRLEV